MPDSDIVDFPIDLPTFPRQFELKGHSKFGNVRTVMWQGSVIEGVLRGFDNVERQLRVEVQPGKTTTVHFDEIKYLIFRQALTKFTPITAKQDGNVEYRDGTIWHGRVPYFLVSGSGLHLLVDSGSSIHRYFIPDSSIKGYALGGMHTTMPQAEAPESIDFLAMEPESTTAIGSASDEEQRKYALSLGLQMVHLHDITPHEEAVSLVPEHIARQYRLIPINEIDNLLVIAMVDPTSMEALNLVGFVTGMTLDPVMTTNADLDWALDHYYSPSQDVAAFEGEEEPAPKEVDDQQLLMETRRVGSERPIVKLVNDIFAQAINRKASDIHLRPGEKTVQLLLRIDGNLIFIREFHKNVLQALASRIKIIGGMDIATRMVPQDGQTRFIENGVVIDMRISIIPTVDGESIVIRVLNTKYGPMSISQLGMTEKEETTFLNFLEKSHGLVLVTGPTGSGKSTTLYAALDAVKRKNLSIITVEDPVEFHIPGVDQVQVSDARGLTFARALRNILRHDPEVIMIGEVRDSETAKIAVQSALTGHLVLSTLHTNNALGAISRMADMGVESYLLGPTLLCVIAQRLLKKICSHCKEVDDVSQSWRHALHLGEDEVFYRGKGCDKCNGRGLSGRVGIYEVLGISERMAAAIIAGERVTVLTQIAEEEGMVSLFDNALRLARDGQIQFAEVYALASEA